MAFHVYPDDLTNPHLHPLLVLAGGASPLVPIVELAAVDPMTTLNTMYIRVVMLGSGCAPSGGAAPTVKLKANTGDEYTVPNYPTTVAIFNLPGNAGAEVADATLVAEANDVYLLKVFIFSAGSSWQIRIGNNDGAAHGFTWVVASTDAEAKQPWIDAPTDLDFSVLGDILVGDSVVHTVSVPNKGTGPLLINDTTLTPLGAGFSIVAPLPGPIQPNTCGDVKIAFHAPARIGEQDFSYTINSGDNLATLAAGHNKKVQMKATARKLEVVMVLDGSGSMSYTPNGSGPAVALSDSRWGKMTAAADQFLVLLTAFGGGRGRVAIVEFPDITNPGFPPPAVDLSAKVLRPAIDIPKDVTSLNNPPLWPVPPEHSPKPGFGWTPMGRGIGMAMGTIAGSFGEFEGGASKDLNRRWLLLMSDGAHNLGNAGTIDHPTFYYGPASSQTSFKGKNIKVFAAAYGDEGAINWPPDHPQMMTLRTESNGVYSDAGTNDLGSDPGGDLGLNVFKSFRAAITAGLALDPTIDPGGVLTGGAPEARYPISVLPYDTRLAFVVNWGSFDAERVSVQLLTPNCELITPALAMEDPGLSYVGHPRYAIYTVETDYLRNARDPSHPRHGTWKLIIIGNGLEEGGSEAYEFEVITQSRLKMKLEFDREQYFAGDPIGVAARLTLDGKPITNATVTWTLDAPGQSATNWLALSKVTPVEFEKAADAFQGDDVTPLAIKKHSLQLKGVTFTPFKKANTAAMVDPASEGVYRATTNDTRVPGTYNFRITALGTTEGGGLFRREQQVQVYLGVRPHIDFIVWDILYRQILINERPWIEAVIRVLPRDPFGNVLLVEPEFNPLIKLTARGGEFAGPLVGNLDGSYTRALRYLPDVSPTIALEVGGETVVPARPLTPVAGLQYVDRVDEFKPGGEAVQGANQHADPKAALGSVLGKAPDTFVALGAYGSLAVSIQGQSILAQGDDDITVFVRQDADLRPYFVEALRVGKQDAWVLIGNSAGITQSFGLTQAGLQAAGAIRITDTSGRTRDSDFNPSATPGVSVIGVGFKKAGSISTGCQCCLGMLKNFCCWIRQWLGSLSRP